MRRRHFETPEQATPEHLRIGSALCEQSPGRWRAERLAYLRGHADELRAEGISPLSWIIETRQAARQARGLTAPRPAVRDAQ